MDNGQLFSLRLWTSLLCLLIFVADDGTSAVGPTVIPL